MTNNYTNTQLKQALAKMLPDTLWEDADWIFWKHHCHPNCASLEDVSPIVLDTELLNLCSLVEATLDTHDGNPTTPIGEFWECKYDRILSEIIDSSFTWKATWQQRTIALAKVKGVKIV